MHFILLDDDADDLLLARMLFRSNGIGSLDVCQTMDELLYMLHRRKYNAIFIDYKLSGLSGVEIAKDVRRVSKLPIYIITNYDKVCVENEASEQNVDIKEVIAKPVMLFSLRKEFK